MPNVITPEEIERRRLLRVEMELTQLWYLRMSGEVPWSDGKEKKWFSRQFEEISTAIKSCE